MKEGADGEAFIKSVRSQSTLLVASGRGNIVVFLENCFPYQFCPFPPNFSAFMGHDVQFLT